MTVSILPVLGADIELGNAWTGSTGRTNLEAASRVLRQLKRLGRLRGVDPGGGSFYGLSEWGRNWLVNGGCIYVDMAHIEVCPPETLSARDHTAAVHAMYRIIRTCRRRACASLPEGEDIFVNIHNSDGTMATSWGAHQNASISRSLWNALFQQQKPHLMALLASFVAATVPVFGQGMIVPLGRGCRYVTSARAHHLGSLVTLSTTEPYNRGLLNSRDEPHSGDSQARLHLIAYDANLQPASILMRSGLVQLVVAALERGWFDAALLIDNPVDAVQGWSWSFCAETGAMRPGRVPRPGGTPIGLFEWHKRLLKGLRGLVSAGVVPDAVVPEGAHILDLWEETLDDLVRADLPRLARRLDWALKWSILSEVVTAPGDLEDQQLRLLDQYYGHIDDRVGLFWPFWKQGLVDQVVDASAVRRFLTAGDPRTRSGLRAELVRRLKPWIDTMDWSYVEISREGQRAWWQPSERRRVALADPSEVSGPRIEQLRSLVPENSQLLELLTATVTDESIPRTSRSALAKYPLAPYPLFPETTESDNPRSSSDDDHRTFPSAN